MARLIFINRYFFPDHSATSQILSDLAFHLAATGHEVHVITSSQLYDDAHAALPPNEIVTGVNVHRVASTWSGRAALAGRALDYLSFYRSARRCLHAIVRPSDIVVAKTDPPLLSVVLGRMIRRRGAYMINWLQDIYPETAAVLGVPLVRGPVAAVLVALRNRSLRRAETIVVVGELMAHRVKAFGIAPERVHVIANWCDDKTIKPLAGDNTLRESWHLTGKFVVAYSGNLGRAHDYETTLAAAELLRDEPGVAFLVIGGGKHFDYLITAVKARGLEHSFHFRSYQERALLPYSLSVGDVHWLSLDPALEGLIVPSKFYAIAAAGKPMVMIGDNEGEVGRLIRQYRCGITVAPGDAAKLADTLRHWSEDPRGMSEMGARARQMLDTQCTRRRALESWELLIGQLSQLKS